MLTGVSIIGAGHRVPLQVVTNERLCLGLKVTPQWIEARTGISSRRIAEPDERASDYALQAALNALSDAHKVATEIDLIIVATFSGDYVFPAAAVKLQKDLGILGAHAFDVQANCAGFVTALSIAAERMKFDQSIRTALVVGLEFCSRYTDKNDEETAIYLSDGAGAVVLGRTEKEGYISSSFWTDPTNYESVRLRGGGSAFRNPSDFATYRFMEMNGLATWRQAISWLPKVIKDAASKGDLDTSDIDKYIFHQANLRLIEYLMKKAKRSLDATFTNVERIGNTGAASISIALSEAKQAEFFATDDFICIAGVGAGFTFGASIWRWTNLA